MTYPKCYCDKHVKIWAKAGLMHDSVRNIYPFEDSKQECKHVFANLDTKCKNQVSFLVEDVPLEAQVVQTTDGREFGVITSLWRMVISNYGRKEVDK